MSEAEAPSPPLYFSEIAKLPTPQQRKHELLRLLDSLMAQAIRGNDWPGALKVFSEATEIINRK